MIRSGRVPELLYRLCHRIQQGGADIPQIILIKFDITDIGILPPEPMKFVQKEYSTLEKSRHTSMPRSLKLQAETIPTILPIPAINYIAVCVKRF